MSRIAADAALNRGLAARAAGNHEIALRAFEVVIALDPESPAGYLLAADMHLVAGRSAMALKLSKRGLTFNCTVPNRSLGLQICAMALANLRRREALAAADDAVSNDPANASNHRVLGQVLFSVREFTEAEAAFRQAIALAPASVETLVLYAQFLQSRRRISEAQEIAARAALIEPDALEVLILRGQLAFRTENLAMARDLALWALSRAAMNRQALELLALVKSRGSVPTAPFWWCFNFLYRAKWRAPVFFLAGVTGVYLHLLFASPPPDPTGLPGLTSWLIGGLLAYTLLCICHVGWLVRRDLRAVKLKRRF